MTSKMLVFGILSLSVSAFFVGEKPVHASYAVATCTQTGAMGLVGNVGQDISVVKERAINECRNNGGTDCEVLTSSEQADAYVSIARGTHRSRRGTLRYNFGYGHIERMGAFVGSFGLD